MLSSEDRAEIQARTDAATKGPWMTITNYASGEVAEVFAPASSQTVFGAKSRSRRWEAPIRVADAEFIAHAREDIPKLLAELTRIEQALEREGLAALIDRAAPSSTPQELADAIRTHLLGDNEGKTTL